MAYLTSVTTMHTEGEVSIDKKTNPDWWLNDEGSPPILIRIFFLYMRIKRIEKGASLFFFFFFRGADSR